MRLISAFVSLWAAVTKVYFWKRDWELGNWCTKFLILDIKSLITCGKSNRP